MSGYGVAASAFGIGAARTHGATRHVKPLTGQALVASWPLPDGSLLVPRLLSNFSDAPYVGEAALLFSLTRMPLPNTSTAHVSGWPISVYLGLSIYLILSLLGGWMIYLIVRPLVSEETS